MGKSGVDLVEKWRWGVGTPTAWEVFPFSKRANDWTIKAQEGQMYGPGGVTGFSRYGLWAGVGQVHVLSKCFSPMLKRNP